MESPATAVEITDLGTLRKYFTTVPNMVIDDEELTRDEIALYLYYKRVAGESGVCFKSNSNAAKGAKMGTTLLKECRARLVQLGYLEVEESPGVPTQIRIVNVWDANMERYIGGREATTLPGRVASTRGREATGGGRAASTGGREATTKKNDLKTLEEESDLSNQFSLSLPDPWALLKSDFENTLGLIGGDMVREAMQYARTVPHEWYIDALAITREAPRPSWAYCKGVLDRCLSEQRPPRRREAAAVKGGDHSARGQMLGRYRAMTGGN